MTAAEILLIGLSHIYQFAESEQPTQLEQQQRELFLTRMADIISTSQPKIIADESPDTNNPQLLALYPADALQVCVDVPHDVKVQRGLYIGRPPDSLCPYVDTLRERYWRWKLHRVAKGAGIPKGVDALRL